MFIIVAFGNFFHIFKKILLKFAEVAPVGAWIEIMLVTGARKAVMEVAPVGAWIEIMLVTSRHHFREEPSIISDLFPETLILRESGSGTREILEFYLKDHDCDVDCFSGIQEITNMNAIRILTEEDCGITFLYESVVRDSIRRGAIRQIPLKDFHIVHNIVFIWRKNSIFSGEYQEIFRELS